MVFFQQYNSKKCRKHFETACKVWENIESKEVSQVITMDYGFTMYFNAVHFQYHIVDPQTGLSKPLEMVNIETDILPFETMHATCSVVRIENPFGMIPSGTLVRVSDWENRLDPHQDVPDFMLFHDLKDPSFETTLEQPQ